MNLELPDSKSGGRKVMKVQFHSRAPKSRLHLVSHYSQIDPFFEHCASLSWQLLSNGKAHFMEHFKTLTEILEADPRSAAFAKLNLETGTTEPMVLADVHGLIAPITLCSEVPEEIRSYIEAVKTLYVYGWFYYPFQTLAAFLSTTAVEMSLSMRLGKNLYERIGFTKLLIEPKEKGVLQGAHDAIAAMWERIEQSQAPLEGDFDTTPGPPVEAHFEAAWKSLIKLRNTFAHPKGHWIMSPGMALDLLRFSVEVINGLWTQSQSSLVEKAG